MERVPIFLLVTERPRMLKAMVDSIVAVTDPDSYELFIIDNCCVGEEAKACLSLLEERFTVLRNEQNFGLRGFNAAVPYIKGPHFIMSDPDLLLNPDMPRDWTWKLCQVLDTRPDVYKIGLALNIEFKVSNAITEMVRGISGKYWVHKKDLSPIIEDVAYSTQIDTTLCCYRTSTHIREDVPGRREFLYHIAPEAISVAGRYTAEHLGWDVYGEYAEELRFYSEHCHLGTAGSTAFLKSVGAI